MTVSRSITSLGPRVTIPAAILLLLVVLVLTAPTAARYGLEKLIGERLQVPVSIEDVDLDLLDGQIGITNLHISGTAGSDFSGANLYADIHLGALLRGDIVVESVRLAGLSLEILRADSGQVVVVVPLEGADTETADTAIEIPLFELQELAIADAEVEVDLPPVQGRFRIETFNLGMLSTVSDEPARLELSADWNGAPLAVNGSLAPFDPTPWFEGEISLQGLALGEAQPHLPAPLAGLGGTLDTRWRGRISSDSLALEGEVALQDAQASLENLLVRADALSWQGRLEAGDLGEAPQIDAIGDVNGSGLGVTDPARGITLIEIAGVLAEQLGIDEAGALSVANVEIDRMRAVDTGDEEQRLVRSETVRISDLELRDNQLVVGAISGENVVSNLYFSAQGGLVARGVLTTSFEAFSSRSDETAEAEPLAWRVEETSLRDSRMTVVDRQFAHPFRVELSVEELSLGALDSSRPDTPAALNLKAKVGEYGRVEVNGEIAALAPASHTELEGHISSLALHTLSPYSEYLLGYELVAGQYDHEFDISIENSHITASNELHLRQTKVRKMEDAEPVAPLPMPLGAALDMLRDRDDDIQLSVPLDGQLDDPDFGLNQAISRALAKGLRAGSTTYLKFVLQPYGAIWAGAEMGMKLVGQVQLDPMPFPAGTVELGPVQLDYAAKLAQMLIDRPGIELRACGKAGRADFSSLLIAEEGNEEAKPDETGDPGQPAVTFTPEQEAQMRALAEQRADALKRWLVNEKGIAPERIYLCKPIADPAGEVSGIRLNL